MAAWDDLLTAIRVELDDTTEAYKFSDALLFLFCKDAIRDFSQCSPLKVFREERTASGGKFTLPANLLSIDAAEMPLNTYLEEVSRRPGTVVNMPFVIKHYRVVGGYLYTEPAPNDGEILYLTYSAVHAIPTSEDDDSTVMTFPAEDEELIRLYVRAKVMEQQRAKQSSLDRFKMGSGSRDDNPLLPEHNELMWEYRRRIAERSGGIVILYKPGRRK
jgi:hypothetical protein